MTAEDENDDAGARDPSRKLSAAAKTLDLEAARRAIEAGADPNFLFRGYRPLHIAISERAVSERPNGEPAAPPSAAPPNEARVAFVKLLLEAGADAELTAGYPPVRALLAAAIAGDAELVALFRKKSPVDGFAEAAIGDVKPLRQRLARGPQVARTTDAAGLTALHLACASRLGAHDPKVGRTLTACAEALLDAGANPNAKARVVTHEYDAASFAASSHQLATLRLLLDRGANATDALSATIWNAPREYGELVLGRGGDPNRAQHEARPLLHQLIRWGQVEPALFLLEKGADPNRLAVDGWTALHQAASRGNLRMVEACLRAGADRAKRDRKGCTAGDIARNRDRAEIVAAIEKK